MHAGRRASGTSRRTVLGRRTRYSVCGLPRAAQIATRGTQRLGRRRVWSSGAVCFALVLCAFWMIRNSPIVVADPAQRALVMRFTFEDFANAAR